MTDESAPHVMAQTDQIQQAGRLALLHDLQRRALAADSTRDPAVVQDLIAALTAFLNEELDDVYMPRGTSIVTESAADIFERRFHD